MSRTKRALPYLRGVMLLLALLLPIASLLPLGWLWLWQQGYALYWLAAAFAIAICGYIVQAFALRKAFQPGTEPRLIEDAGPVQADSGWTAREQAAWAAVEAIAADVRPTELTDRDKVINLGFRTIEAVARQIHPSDHNPLWKFTIPEALALIERVSADLRPFVTDNIPLGDQLTVGQVLKIYRWRSAIGVAERAYDIWRLVRLINPVTAAAQEAREQITKRLYASVRDQLAKRLAQGYIREVGLAAIDLYGGRLKVSAAELAGHVSGPTLRDRGASPARAEPLRILVAGRAGSGKSSIVNALAKEVRAVVNAPHATQDFQAHELELEGLASALVIDSPGIGASSKQQRLFSAKAGECDLILWMVDATKAGDQVDRGAIDSIRTYFADRPHRREPPIVVALTHIDALQPAWPLPSTKAPDRDRSIRDTAATVARQLEIEPSDIVPVSVAAGREPYNVEMLSARIAACVPEAQRAQLLRLMEDAAPRLSVKRFWKQAANAAWSAARNLTPASLKR